MFAANAMSAAPPADRRAPRPALAAALALGAGLVAFRAAGAAGPAGRTGGAAPGLGFAAPPAAGGALRGAGRAPGAAASQEAPAADWAPGAAALAAGLAGAALLGLARRVQAPRRVAQEARLVLRAAKKGTPLEDLNTGDKVNARVTRVAQIGIWVDIGAEKEALWPRAQVGAAGMTKYKVGDTIKDMTIFELKTGTTASERKIRVTTKSTTLEFEVGQILEGTVSTATQFGVFFDVGASSDVLAPTSMLKKATGEYKEGDKVTIKIAKVEGDRVTVTTDLEAAERTSINELRLGQEVSGTVRSVVDFGIFIDIGVEREALCRSNQLASPITEYKEGDFVTGLKVSNLNIEKSQVELSSRKLASDVVEGEKLEGVVVKVSTFGVFFDAGLAADVLVPTRSLSKPMEEYKEGEVADLTVIKVDDGRVTATTLGDIAPLSEVIRGTMVKGTVAGKAQLGLFVNIGAVRDALWREQFLPKPMEEYSTGDVIEEELMVIMVDAVKNTIEVNSLEGMAKRSKEQAERAEDGSARSMEDLPVGTPVEGTVKRVTPFGVFLDIGAERDALYAKDQVEGDMDQIKVGQTITGIRICMNDMTNMRLAVSPKKCAADFKVGDTLSGKVLKAMPFGVFVDVGASTDALVPAVLLKKPPTDYKPGDELPDLTVSTLDVAENKITAQEVADAGEGASGDQKQLSELREGQQVDGIVRAVKDYGVFVDIGIARRDALLPASLMKDGMVPEDFEPGSKIEGYIASVDLDLGRIGLSMTAPEAGASSGVASGAVEGLEWMPGGGPPMEIPVGHMLFDMDWWHDSTPEVRMYYGDEFKRLGFPSWKTIQEKCPDLFVLPEKEVDELFGGADCWKRRSSIPHDPLIYTQRPKQHFIPVPPHLRKPNAEIPEDLPDQWKYKEGEPEPTYDTLIKPQIHTKYMPPPLNDPNFVWPYHKRSDGHFVPHTTGSLLPLSRKK